MALPGFGSLAAGRKVGYFQASLAITGVTISAIFMVRFAAWYFANKASLDGELMDPVEALLLVWRASRMCLAGIGIFVLAWLWALGTSLMILSAAKEPPPLAKLDSRRDSGTPA